MNQELLDILLRPGDYRPTDHCYKKLYRFFIINEYGEESYFMAYDYLLAGLGMSTTRAGLKYRIEPTMEIPE